MFVGMWSKPVICICQKHFSTNILCARYLASRAHVDNHQKSTDVLATLNEVIDQGPNYGCKRAFSNEEKKKIVVDFSSPNVAKMFHIGHFRSTVIGNSLCNIMIAAGHNVHKINYLGDWGFQFALLAIGYNRFGNAQHLKDNPLMHLNDVYIKVNAEVESDKSIYNEAQDLFAKMENGDDEVLEFWSLARKLSINEFKTLYNRINVKFDEITGESQYVQPAKTIVERLNKLKLITKEGRINLSGSSWISGKQEHEVMPVIFRQNATTLYLTRDVAAAIHRYETYKFDKMIYVTDYAQCLHFNQVFAILEKMGYAWASKEADKLCHVAFGRVKNMHTRAGQTVFLRDILDEAHSKVQQDRLTHATRKTHIKEVEKVVDTLALTGLLCHDIRGTLNKDYTFSWDAILSSKGNCGLFLQYSHSRLYSLEKNCGIGLTNDIDPTQLNDRNMADLLKQISKYSFALRKTYNTMEPSVLLHYLYDLCHAISKALRSCQVQGMDKNVAEARLLCFHCARIVLSNGIKLLGLTPLNEM